VAEQFDVIEAGERGRRRWTLLLVVVALLLIPAIGLLVSRDPDPEAEAESPAATATPEPIRSLTRLDNAPNIVNPPAVPKQGDEVIQVVFPHGVRAEVRYPAELNLDALGSRPFQGAWVEGRFRQFVAPYGGQLEVTRGGQPIRNYAPNVTLWPRQAGSGFYGQVLLFEFGPWRLAMYDRGEGLTFDQRMSLARNLRGRVTKEGYLVLSARRDIRLTRPGERVQGHPVGPQLWFGGGAGQMLALVPTPDCAGHRALPEVIEGRGRPSDMVCRGDMLIAVTGSTEFREKAIEGIRVTVK
jgi:hypothetical protein